MMMMNQDLVKLRPASGSIRTVWGITQVLAFEYLQSFVRLVQVFRGVQNTGNIMVVVPQSVGL